MEASSVYSLIRTVGHNRYHKLNMHSLERQKTVEFRQHTGTVEADKIAMWAEFCIRFVEYSKTSRVRRLTTETTSTPVASMAANMKCFNMPAHIDEFYRARCKHFVSLEKTEKREAAKRERAIERRRARERADLQRTIAERMQRLERDRTSIMSRLQRRYDAMSAWQTPPFSMMQRIRFIQTRITHATDAQMPEHLRRAIQLGERTLPVSMRRADYPA